VTYSQQPTNQDLQKTKHIKMLFNQGYFIEVEMGNRVQFRFKFS